MLFLKDYIFSKEIRFKMGMDLNEITRLMNSGPKLNFIYKGLYILKRKSFLNGNGLQQYDKY